jgi:hypothetical protein
MQLAAREADVKWKLFTNGDGEADIDVFDLEPRPAPMYSFSLLHELAKDPANRIVEIEPGVFEVQKDETGYER